MNTSAHLLKSALRLASVPFLIYLGIVVLVYVFQRSLLYFPSHRQDPGGLPSWRHNGTAIGCCHEVARPGAVWLMAHGNGGQASDRGYVLPRMSPGDSLYVLEYPGYGSRPGSPSMQSMKQAAAEAYRALRATHPGVPVCVLGESLGTGPASSLALEPVPPDKITLVVPFDTLANVAAKHYWFLPVRLLLRDPWDNIKSLQHYSGPVEIYGAAHDTIIPVNRARALAKAIPSAVFTELDCGHNQWADSSKVKIAR